MPPELNFLAVADRVGGYSALVELERDARRFDMVVAAMNGEAEARRIVRLRTSTNRQED